MKLGKPMIRNKRNECYDCVHKRSVAGNAHIKCVNPDPEMEGERFGITSGWFFYPDLFDPTWKEKDCGFFKEREEV